MTNTKLVAKITKISILAAALLTIGLFFHLQRAGALDLTFTVDSTGDAADDNPGDGICETAGGVCTLRAAIEEANATAGADRIEFNIAGAGPHVITPLANLPVIEDEVVIDGATQPGASCGDLVGTLPQTSNTPHTLRIQINGVNGDNDGILTVAGGTATDTVIRGLAITGLSSGGIAAIRVPADADYAENMVIECNYLGTTASGLADTNTDDTARGIWADAEIMIRNNLIAGDLSEHVFGFYSTIEDNLIGVRPDGLGAYPGGSGGDGLVGSGFMAVTNNVIGAVGNGISITGMNGGNDISGNYIGYGINGTTAIPNANHGLLVSSADGGLIADNQIGNNQASGIALIVPSVCGSVGIADIAITGNTVTDNQENGVLAQATSRDCGDGGILHGSVAGIVIGSSQSEDVNDTLANTISGNGQDGVRIVQGPAPTEANRVSVVGNSIFDNNGLGINLAHDANGDGTPDSQLGPNPNGNNEIVIEDPTRANDYLNYPTINSATGSSDSLTVTYNFTANPFTAVPPSTCVNSTNIVGYRLDFYASPTPDESGYGEGRQYIGGFVVDGSETNAEHTFTGVNVDSDASITATATYLYVVVPYEECVTQDTNTPSWLSRVVGSVKNFFVPTVYAAEIDYPDDWIPGSTSEFSPAVQAAVTSDGDTADPASPADLSSDPLAPTGMSFVAVLAAGTSLIGAALWTARRSRI